jgi:hypothetical protein
MLRAADRASLARPKKTAAGNHRSFERWDRRRRKCYPLRLAGPSLSLGCFLLLLAIDMSFEIWFLIHFGPKAC